MSMIFPRIPSHQLPAPNWTPETVGPSHPPQQPDQPRLLALIRAAWRRRRSRIDLSRLDARMLKDIGLTYADVDQEANKPFWRP
ncbi:DUF1127 domain-containing protein [Limobrevibacterium gyesilva]|uniref:DUF1127 domain-containing protein n=1 Tax=Limobrevibacterium gyesilva TaxID=2991712 RepID=A0AA41YQ37_9PROT|nr:DUF1127 domain-containing protein [Limobrevibacterium gyesilva]MCW3476651.1 DUF1127 domain-containing protein [Limobrevibacterium gyesilva]